MSAPDVAALFRQYFGAEPEVVALAPGRANLVGEHVDYCGGLVLPVAIGVRIGVAMRRLSPRSASTAVSGTGAEGAARFDPLALRPVGRWTDYLSGVAGVLAALGTTIPPVEVAVASDIPVGAGLSSSAALSVAAAMAFSALAGEPCDPRALATVALRAERSFVGIPCGIMDPLAVSLGRAGHAIAIDCHAGATELLPFDGAVLLVDTGAQRALVASAYRQRVTECAMALDAVRLVDPATRDLASASPAAVEAALMSPEVRRRARHVVGEMARVRQAIAQLRASGTLDGALLSASHDSLRDLYECSTPALDWLAREATRLPGVAGARLTGAGWGGCLVAIGDDDALRASAPRLAAGFASQFGRPPRWWLLHAADGATLESGHVAHRS
ncbi:MAG: galactokinase [Gemmatimonadetes bacterium]|nr:galactokinase [Gemmatimonadota bacterium]